MAYVLIAEDDEDSRLLLHQMLISLGHEVIAVNNGTEALEAAKLKTPDLIISDILMPEMDGYELCREVRKNNILQTVPFVFYTATYESEEDERLAIDFGGSGFIRKGRDASKLMEVLDDIIGRVLKGHAPIASNPDTAEAELATRHEQAATKKLAKKDTELKAARESHQQDLKLLDAVFNATMSAMIAIDSSGKIVVWNAAAIKNFGYEKNEAIGQNAHDLLSPTFYLPRIKSGLQKFAASGEGPVVGRTSEFIAKRKDGSVFPASFNVGSFKRGDEWWAVAMVRDITELKKLETQKKDAQGRLKGALISTLEAISVALEQRDHFLEGHQIAVGELCMAIGRELELPVEMIEGMRLGAAIHDIGNLCIPPQLLNKPVRLSEDELLAIRPHPQVGFDIVKDAQFPWPIAEMILQHHERIDGSGYPSGLKGESIILEAKILAVADVVQAMCSERPHRPALGVDGALEYISINKGKKFDSSVVDACVRAFKNRGFAFE